MNGNERNIYATECKNETIIEYYIAISRVWSPYYGLYLVNIRSRFSLDEKLIRRIQSGMTRRRINAIYTVWMFQLFSHFFKFYFSKEVRKHKGCTFNTITYKEPMHKNFALGLISRNKAFTWSSQNSLHFFKIHFQYQGIVCFLLDPSPIIRQCIFLRRGIKYIVLFCYFNFLSKNMFV